MPRPCHRKHDAPENFAQANTAWSKNQCATCWQYLNSQSYREACDKTKEDKGAKVTGIEKTSGCCGKTAAEKIITAGQSFASWAGDNFRKPNEEQLAIRESICKSNICGKHDSVNDKCNDCGCWLKKVLPIVGDVGKRNHAIQECPQKLWGPV